MVPQKWTDGQTDKHTDTRTDRRTNQLIESIGPEGRCLENTRTAQWYLLTCTQSYRKFENNSTNLETSQKKEEENTIESYPVLGKTSQIHSFEYPETDWSAYHMQYSLFKSISETSLVKKVCWTITKSEKTKITFVKKKLFFCYTLWTKYALRLG